MSWFEITLFAVATVFLIGGADDLIVDLIRIFFVRRTLPRRFNEEEWVKLKKLPETRIAVMIPAWQEASVLDAMVMTNFDRIAYQNYRFFIGVYPNDAETLSIAKNIQRRFPERVKVTLTDQPGPTSKAHCLNCLLQDLETKTDTWVPDWVVIHDAEDVIDPDSFSLVNGYGIAHPRVEFIQIPVFAMPVKYRNGVAGTYLDEFAEVHLKELPAKQQMGLPIPSAGVGTFLSWTSLRHLRKLYGYYFDEGNLTEDYELSLRVARLGGQQAFLIAKAPDKRIIATREYFPENFRASIRQKTRWATGITLQSAAKWSILGVRHWPRRDHLKLMVSLFRDRRALWVNPAVLLAWILIILVFAVFPFFPHLTPALKHRSFLEFIFLINLMFALNRVLHRFWWTRQLYGNWNGLLSFPRIFLSILINGIAALRALLHFRRAVREGTPKRIAWAKTEHRFPTAKEISDHLKD